MTSRRTRRAKALKILAVLVVIGAGLAAAAGWYVRYGRQGAHLERAKQAMVARDYDQAIAHLNNYTRRQKKNAEAWLMLSEAVENTPNDSRNHITRAATFAREAHALEPGRLDIIDRLLRLYGSLGQSVEALDLADRALAIDANHRFALDIRTEALAAAGKFDEALANEQRIADLAPDDFLVRQRIVAMMVQAGRDSASILELIERWEPKFGNHAAYWVTRASHLGIMGRTDQSVSMILRAAAMPLRDVRELEIIMDQLAITRVSRPETGDEARRFLDRVLTQQGDRMDLVRAAARRAFTEGEPAIFRRAVLMAAKELSSAEPVELATWVMGATGDEQLRDVRAQAIERIDRLATPGADSWRDLVRAWESLDEGRVAEARNRADKIRPQTIDPEFQLLLESRVALALGELVVARTKLEQLTTNPAWHIARRELARVRLAQGDAEGTLQLARIDPKIATTDQGLTLVLEATVRRAEALDATTVTRQEAVAAFDRIIAQLKAVPPEVVALQSRALLAAGRTQDSVLLAQRVATFDPPPPTNSLVDLADRLRLTDPALTERLLARARQIEPDSPAILYASAVQMAAAGDAPGGSALLKDALEKSTAQKRVELSSYLATYEDRFGNRQLGRDALERNARDRRDDVMAQIAFLSSTTTWSSATGVSEAIDRLRQLTGEDAVIWKLYEAQRVLTFTPTDKPAISRAAQLLGDVNRVDPGNARALAYLAECHLALGDRQQAIRRMQEAVTQGGEAIVWYPRLIELLLADGQAPAAEQQLRAFSQINGLNEPLRISRALLKARLGLAAEAIDDLMLGAAAGDEACALEVIRLRMREGNQAEAERVVAPFLDLPTPPPNMLAIAADLAGLRDDVPAAEALLARLPDDPPHRLRSVRQAEFYARFAMHEQAEAKLNALAQAGMAEAYVMLARMALERNDNVAAKSAIDKGLARFPSSPDLLKLRGVMALASGGGSASDALLDVARGAASTQPSPGLEELIAILQRQSSGQARAEETISAVTRLVASYPTLFEGYRVLAHLQMDAGQNEGAAGTARALAERLPNDPRALEYAARTLSHAGRLDEARTVGLRWREVLGVQSFEPDCFLAAIDAEVSRPAQALERLRPWVPRITEQASPDDPKRLLLGIVLAQTGDLEAAANLLWPADPTPQRLSRYLSVVDSIATNAEGSRTWIERATPLMETSADGRLGLAGAWYAIGARPTGSPDDLKRVIALVTGHEEKVARPATAHLLVASAHQALDQNEQAEASYRKGLALVPEHAPALNNLAYILANKPSVSAEASALAQKAVDIAERQRASAAERSAYLDTLGLTLLRTGRAEDAARRFQQAADLQPRAGGPAIGLAEASMAMGRREEARRSLTLLDRVPEAAQGLSANERRRLEQVRAALAQR